MKGTLDTLQARYAQLLKDKTKQPLPTLGAQATIVPSHSAPTDASTKAVEGVIDVPRRPPSPPATHKLAVSHSGNCASTVALQPVNQQTEEVFASGEDAEQNEINKAQHKAVGVCSSASTISASIVEPDRLHKLNSGTSALEFSCSVPDTTKSSVLDDATKLVTGLLASSPKVQVKVGGNSTITADSKKGRAGLTDTRNDDQLDKPNQLERLFVFSKLCEGTKLGQKACELFRDEKLLSSCEQALNAELQRTKDGATTESRVRELAALVKQLRKAVKDITSRQLHYVEFCALFEKEHAQQVQSAQLSSDSNIKIVEAELAQLRRNLAQAEATHKREKADWVSELEATKAETNCLKRELERLADEREKSREESRATEARKNVLEAELRELKRATQTQLNEAAQSKEGTLKLLNDEVASLEEQLRALQEAKCDLTFELQTSRQLQQSTNAELGLQKEVLHRLQESLDQKSASETLLKDDLNQVKSELNSLHIQLLDAQKEGSQLRVELHATAMREAQLNDKVNAQGKVIEELQHELQSVYAAWDNDKASLGQEVASLRAAHENVTAQAEQLSREREVMRNALQVAVDQKDQLILQGTSLAGSIQQLQLELESQSSKLQEVSSREHILQQQIAEQQVALQQQEGALAQSRARCAQLEGEFETLQEVMGEGDQRAMVTRLLQKVALMSAAAMEAEGTRRRLHNELVELRGNIRVFCRVRPHITPVVRCSTDQVSLQLSCEGKEHSFTYDKVFAPNTAQATVFGAVAELVQSALDGYHVCIFSYGQTGAGKTFTMQGNDHVETYGIIPRSVEKILEAAKKQEEQEWSYTMSASFIEIYQDRLRDLLSGQPLNDQNCILHDSAGGHTVVVGAHRAPVSSLQEALNLVRHAAAARASQATAMNEQSSRSHCVFMLYISGQHTPSNTRLQGCLCLVDLAGSERLDRSLAEGMAKKEACEINKSLSALGDVFTALQAKSSHVPYRNSKLTYLLQPCLGGHGKTLMFVNVNPEPQSAQETLCSLRFAAKVNSCETAAKGGAKKHVMQGLPPSSGAATARTGAVHTARGSTTATPRDAAFTMGMAPGGRATGAKGVGTPLLRSSRTSIPSTRSSTTSMPTRSSISSLPTRSSVTSLPYTSSSAAATPTARSRLTRQLDYKASPKPHATGAKRVPAKGPDGKYLPPSKLSRLT